MDPNRAPEADDLLRVLAERRAFVLLTARDLTDEQARATPTVSTLSIGGLIKHLSSTENAWARFMRDGAAGMSASAASKPETGTAEDLAAAHQRGFTLLPGQTLAQVVQAYQAAATSTEQIVDALPDLDVTHELPPAPWFEPGAAWSARRVLAHLIGETAQHAGHADLIRESIDGQKSMG